MNIKNRRLFFCCVRLSLLFALPDAATAAQTLTAQKTNQQTANQQVTNQQETNQAEGYTKDLRGTIDEKFDVWLRLNFNQQKITGSYFYEPSDAFMVGAVKNPRVALKGSVDARGKFNLTETVNGRIVATWSGTAEGLSDAGEPVDEQSVRLKGMRVAEKTRALVKQISVPFTATEAGFNLLAGEGRIVAQRRIEVSQPQEAVAYRINIARPLLKADRALARRTEAFNRFVTQTIENLLREFDAELKTKAAEAKTATEPKTKIEPKTTTEPKTLNLDYAVMLAENNLISIQLRTEAKTGALPTAAGKSLNFDLLMQRPLDFKSLFKDSSDYQTTLDNLCREVFAKTDFANFTGAARLSVRNPAFSGWNLTPAHLVLTFSVPHVLGDTVDVYVPYRELKTVINPTGAIAKIIE